LRFIISVMKCALKIAFRRIGARNAHGGEKR